MAETEREIRVFVSSPGDSRFERGRLQRVIERLNGEFRAIARLTAIRWESEFYKAHDTFQAQIPEAAQCDLVVAIFRARLGTVLPDDFPRMADGNPYPSGTAYEVLSAIEASKARGMPDVYVFRHPEPPSVRLDDPQRVETEAQWARLKDFFETWFRSADGQFRAAFHTFVSTDDFEGQAETLLRKWLGEKVLQSRAVIWPTEIKGSPFRGLAAFGAKHAPVFFGRNRDTAKAIDRLKDAAERDCAFLLVEGASGAGKSSLVRAGIVPRLTAPGVVPEIDIWRVAVMRPGDVGGDPFHALSTALFLGAADLPEEERGRASALPELAAGDFRTARELAVQLAHADETALKPLLGTLNGIEARARATESYEREVHAALLLVIDQIDELFDAEVDAKVRSRFAALIELLARSGRVWVIATMRGGLIEAFLAEPALRQVKDEGATYDLASPDAAALAEIVREPAAAAGLQFETDGASGETLDERLLKDADRPDLLPLVQFTLEQVFEAARGSSASNLLSFAAYKDLGGIEGAVNRHAEAALDLLSDQERERLPRLLRELVARGWQSAGAGARSEGFDLRSVPVSTAAYDEFSTKLVRTLVDARILLLDGEGKDATVRLAHARVLEFWKRAKEIAAENVDFYRIRADVQEQRKRWEAAKRRRDLLIPRGKPLAEAESIVRQFPDEIAPEISEFVNRSKQRARLLQRTIEAAAVVFALVALVAVWKSYEAVQQRTQAEKNLAAAQASRSRVLAGLAVQNAQNWNAGSALAIALESLPARPGGNGAQDTSEAELALFTAWQSLRERAVLPWSAGDVGSAAFSPDGRRVVLPFADNAARIWDVDSGRAVKTLQGHSDRVWTAAYSADGGRIVTASFDKTARIWNAETGELLTVLKGHDDKIVSAAFSADGRRVVTASYDKTARIWDAVTGELIKQLPHDERVLSAAFSRDGRHLVTNSRIWDLESGSALELRAPAVQAMFSPDDRRVVTVSRFVTAIWNAQTGHTIARLESHARAINSAAFSADGRRIVTASEDQTGAIWDAETGRHIRFLSGHGAAVKTAVFSRDGRFVLTASDDNTARLWNADTGAPVAIFRGHQDDVWGAVFGPDDKRILTVSGDGTARIWDMDAKGAETVLEHATSVPDAEFSPSGQSLVTAAHDGKIAIWDASSGRKINVFGSGDSVAMSATFSPDGRRILVAGVDRTAILDADTGKLLTPLRGDLARDGALSASFSPDGRRVLTTHLRKIRIWDAETGKVLVDIGTENVARSAKFDPDGRNILTVGDDAELSVWDASTGELKQSVHVSAVPLMSLDVRRGRILIASHDNKIAFIIADRGARVIKLAGHEGGLWRAAFSADGRRVVTASDDKTARLWEAETGHLLAVLKGHQGKVFSASFSPDGQRIVTASEDKTVRIWRIFASRQALVDEARKALPRCLTREERAQAFLDLDPPAWCIELEKWPYQGTDWRDWLRFKRADADPPMPGTDEWKAWIERRRGTEAR